MSPIGPNDDLNTPQVVEMDLPIACVLTVNAVRSTQSGEAHTIPTTPYQVTITPPNGDTFLDDLGVKYANGTPLARIGGGAQVTPTVGQYAVFFNTYYFAAADAGQGVSISYTHTNGVCDVSCSLTLSAPNSTPISAGCNVKMNPTDPASKLLYSIRGAALQLMKEMTWLQFLPALASLGAGYGNSANGNAALPAPGAGFVLEFGVDMIAMLPENPGNMGL